MANLVGSRIAGGNSEYGRCKGDFYPTPPEATIALMRFLSLEAGTKIWEPACGENHMVNAMLSAGDYTVIGTDIQSGDDFLSCAPKDCDWIITNPPFSIADDFAKRCMDLKKPFALLLKSQYFHAKKRLGLFEQHQPEYILPLTWRPDFLFNQRGHGQPLMDMIWVVWGAEPAIVTKYMPLRKPT